MTECAECGGVGLVRVLVDDEPRKTPQEAQEAPQGKRWASRPCPCQQRAQAAIRLGRAHIPEAFKAATLANFRPTAANRQALATAKKFAQEFLPGSGGGKRSLGLILTGSVGVGKTHLSVALMRSLIEDKGIEARFVDVRELLDRLRSSYDSDARESQAAILRPLLTADLVVVDELGAARPSDWVFETIELLIGGLYNRAAPLLVTTNLVNLPAGANGATNDYQRAARQETLGDRIGMRMWSRLQEMCVHVDMTGPDWRGKR